MSAAPDIADVLDARRVIAPHLARTPLLEWPLLSERSGLDVRVKHENHLPTAAFKVRGGINLISRLSSEERQRGVVSATTGNHGQSIAWAAWRFGARAVIVVPEGANPQKVESMRALGAEVRFHGADFDEAREYVEEAARAEGLRYVHSANEPLLIAGVGTWTLELLEDDPRVDVLFVPVGGGSSAAGACIVARALRPDLRVIAVQSAAAPAAHDSWREGRLVERPMSTFAEGVATRTAFELTQSILREHLSDFVLVSDDEIRAAVRLLLETTRNLVEPSGAIALAGALSRADSLRGRRVAVVASGGNVSVDGLRALLRDAGDGRG